jgi:RimJ/RimL family protein N-acetyltransferase
MERDPEVLRYVGRPPLPEVEDYRAKIRSTYLPHYDRPSGHGAWAVIEKASGDFIGGCSLRPGMESPQAAEMGYAPEELEMGYGLRKPSWGRGYATELAQALVRKAFQELGAVVLVAGVTVDNIASVRVLEKAGLRRVGAPFLLPGETEPSVKYVLTRIEFDQQQVRIK